MSRPSQFRSTVDELNWLVNDVQLCRRNGLTVPADVINRFEELLPVRGSDDGSIVYHEHWAIYCELVHRFEDAIGHREAQLTMLERLYVISDEGMRTSPHIGIQYFNEVIDELANDYEKAGKSELATKTFRRRLPLQ